MGSQSQIFEQKTENCLVEFRYYSFLKLSSKDTTFQHRANFEWGTFEWNLLTDCT